MLLERFTCGNELPAAYSSRRTRGLRRRGPRYLGVRLRQPDAPGGVTGRPAVPLSETAPARKERPLAKMESPSPRPTRTCWERNFPATSWPLLQDIRLGGKQGQEALEEFSQRYYAPAFAYVAAIVGDRTKAEDIVQSFFHVAVLCRGLLARADASRGGFRPYFKMALRNYVKDFWRGERRQPDAGVRPEAAPGGWDRISLPSFSVPDREFQIAWARTLLEEAFVRLRSICESRGQREHLDLFQARYVCASAEPPSWDELGRTYAIDGKTARHRAETVARHLRAVLRELIDEQVGSGAAVDEELTMLQAYL